MGCRAAATAAFPAAAALPLPVPVAPREGNVARPALAPREPRGRRSGACRGPSSQAGRGGRPGGVCPGPAGPARSSLSAEQRRRPGRPKPPRPFCPPRPALPSPVWPGPPRRSWAGSPDCPAPPGFPARRARPPPRPAAPSKPPRSPLGVRRAGGVAVLPQPPRRRARRSGRAGRVLGLGSAQTEPPMQSPRFSPLGDPKPKAPGSLRARPGWETTRESRADPAARRLSPAPRDRGWGGGGAALVTRRSPLLRGAGASRRTRVSHGLPLSANGGGARSRPLLQRGALSPSRRPSPSPGAPAGRGLLFLVGL